MDTPTVEMLWEPRDPEVTLKERFGFTGVAEAARWVAHAVEHLWSVPVLSCERIVMSDSNAMAWVRTPTGRMIAKWSVAAERFPRLAALAGLTAWLDAGGHPVSAPVAASDGRLQVELPGASLSVQREVVGDLLDITNSDLVHEAGAVLARLHAAMAAYPDADLGQSWVDPAVSPGRQITQWLAQAPGHVPAMARDCLRRLVDNAPSDPLPRQLVHGDFRSANVLCVGSEVAAVIDFEEASLDHRVVDVARSAVLLGTRFHDWGPTPADVRTMFLDGYTSVSPLTATERRWWEALVLWHSLAMIPSGDDPTGWGSEALAYLRELGRST